EIVSQRALDTLHGLVSPGLDRDRLAPTMKAVGVRQSHHDRWAHRCLEKLEFANEFVIEPADFDANDPDHCSSACLPGQNPWLSGHDAMSILLYHHRSVKGAQTNSRPSDLPATSNSCRH